MEVRPKMRMAAAGRVLVARRLQTAVTVDPLFFYPLNCFFFSFPSLSHLPRLPVPLFSLIFCASPLPTFCVPSFAFSCSLFIPFFVPFFCFEFFSRRYRRRSVGTNFSIVAGKAF